MHNLQTEVEKALRELDFNLEQGISVNMQSLVSNTKWRLRRLTTTRRHV